MKQSVFADVYFRRFEYYDFCTYSETVIATSPKTMSVTHKNEDWITSHLESGDFDNDSEYIRDLIRRDQERHTQLDAIRMALVEGEESALSTRSPEDILQTVKKRRNRNGTLEANARPTRRPQPCLVS